MNAKTVCKLLAVPLLLIAGYEGAAWCHLLGNTSPAPAPTWLPTAAPAAYQPAQQPTGPAVDYDFAVAQVYVVPGGRKVLLGDSPDYTAPGAKTLCVPTALLAGQAPESLVGKHVKGKGRPMSYKGRPEIMADTITVQ